VSGRIPVYVEAGAKKTFASALDWPGWSRGAKDEDGALGALLAHGPRYGRVVSKVAGCPHARRGGWGSGVRPHPP
jgi:hypothetical protein